MSKTSVFVNPPDLLRAYTLMVTMKEMAELFDRRKTVIRPYPFGNSRGHEAVQIALGWSLRPGDIAFPYYRDDTLLLALGITPYEIMLQLLAKDDDPFSKGYTYCNHPSIRNSNFPLVPHQSSATGMQAIPAAGAALGLRYRERVDISSPPHDTQSIVLCSLGDGAMTEGEVSEALQVASVKQLPIIFAVQDNGWSISAKEEEYRNWTIPDLARGYGINAVIVSGSDFPLAYKQTQAAVEEVRQKRMPILLYARVPLLTHHTSGVRMEAYRDDLAEHKLQDPLPHLRAVLAEESSEAEINELERSIKAGVRDDFERAMKQPEPSPENISKHIYAPTPVTRESGQRVPEAPLTPVVSGQGARGTNTKGKEHLPVLMIECVLHTIREVMEEHPQALFFGQDVGERLGGVFREAQELGKVFGVERVFNTGIQEAFIVGSAVGLSAVGLKPIVEVQFADYLWSGLNQLAVEISRSCYLSRGKFPVGMILRVPTGSYGGGGPYHSGSIESVVLRIHGVKVVYPSNGADYKGLFKAAFDDPNPVVVFEHKGLYWSRNPGSEAAKTLEPDANYCIPLGKGRLVLTAEANNLTRLTIVTYGMGVHWALQSVADFEGRIDLIDLRTLEPWDKELVEASVNKTGRALFITEEPATGSFAQALAGYVSEKCFAKIQAPVAVVGAKVTPALPLNLGLEQACLPNPEIIKNKIAEILNYR